MATKGFASDNNAGIHPAILAAIAEANTGHAVGYGGDTLTAKAEDAFKQLFGQGCEVYFVLTGTGANVLSIAGLGKPFSSVLCTSVSHISVDECGAPERFTGCKLVAIETPDGKLTPQLIAPYLQGFGVEHHAQPGMISISQTTELGTVYAIDEIKAISALAHQFGLVVHMDGARIANALVSLSCTVVEITTDAGVDIVSFGGTKNGMMLGESVIVLNRTRFEGMKYHRKQAMQLYSKMRFVSAQFLAYFSNDLWLKNARHSNLMAQKLAEALRHIPHIKITQEVAANGIFARVPKEIIEPLREKFFFYTWDESRSEVRWMCSFDTTEEDIACFVAEIQCLLDKYVTNTQ